MLVLGFAGVVVGCASIGPSTQLGHDSVFDVFIAPDPTQLNSESLKF